MDKTTQALGWNCLPREFREEVKGAYKLLTSPKYLKDSFGRGMRAQLECLFGIRNLTYDAEGEEMLCVSRKRVQDEYRESIGKAHPYNLNSYNRGFHVGCATMLKELFGSKCKPDEAPLSQNPVENCDSEPHISTDCDKPAEPKFTVGDIAVVRGFKHPLLKQDGAIVTILSYHEKGDFYSCAIAPNVGIDVDAKCLEPCTEPTFTDDCQSQSKSRNITQETANCDKQFDNTQRWFRKRAEAENSGDDDAGYPE